MSVGPPGDSQHSATTQRSASSVHLPTHRRFVVILWRVFLIAWILLTLWPISYGITRLAQTGLFVAVWTLTLALAWQYRWLRFSLIALTIAGCVFLSWPGSKPSRARLQDRNIRELRRYLGVPYVWGGESSLGIDCSGLPRRALFQTLWKEGFQTLNPGLIRGAARLWWNDTSARALGEQHQGVTKFLLTAPSLSELDPSRLQPGDLAITANGVHALAYLGDRQWIEADPGPGRVVILRADRPVSEAHEWLRVPVNIVRWTILDPAPPQAHP